MRYWITGCLLLLVGITYAVPRDTHFFFDPVRLSPGTLPEGVKISTANILPGSPIVQTELPLFGNGSANEPVRLSSTTPWSSYATWTFKGTPGTAGVNVNHQSANPSAPVQGDFWYDNSLKVLKYQDNTQTQTLGIALIGLRLVEMPAIKGTAGTLNVGEVVYLTGYNIPGGTAEVELADADDLAKFPPIGVVNSAMTDSVAGTVLTEGMLAGIKTNYGGWGVGSPLWLDTTAGVLTNIRPTALDARVAVIARVVRIHAALGEIWINPNYADEAFPNLIPVDIFITGRINGVLDQGALTQTQICALTCTVLPCRAWSTTDFDLYTATGTAICQYRNTRTGLGPLP